MNTDNNYNPIDLSKSFLTKKTLPNQVSIQEGFNVELYEVNKNLADARIIDTRGIKSALQELARDPAADPMASKLARSMTGLRDLSDVQTISRIRKYLIILVGKSTRRNAERIKRVL